MPLSVSWSSMRSGLVLAAPALNLFACICVNARLSFGPMFRGSISAATMPSMADVPTIAGALGRFVGRRSGRTRLLSAGWSAALTTFRAVTRVLHLLFLEVTGFLFLCFAIVGGGAAIREYHKYKLGIIGPGKIYLASAFALMFLWFGVSSFWRARWKSNIRH